MTDDKPLFIDTNALIYANVMDSPFHIPALQAIQKAHYAERPMWISRQVLREYLVTMTRPQSFPSLTKETVLEQIEKLSQRFHIADDTAMVTKQLLTLTKNHKLGGKQIHDTNIVATMLAYDIPCLLTHNIKDFKRFESVIEIERIEPQQLDF